MIWNYFKIAFRRLQKNKLYTLVNIIGLTIGITSCILIGLFIINELNYDRFNKNADRIVRITMQYGEGGKQQFAYTGTKAGPQLQRTFPQVKAFVRLMISTPIIRNGNILFHEKKLLFADSTFFKVFSFPLLRGDQRTALTVPNTILLTRKTAKKYFGDSDPMGKTLRINDVKDYQVTGIVADAPESSQIKYDFIASFNSLERSKTEEWWTANYITYLLLGDKNDIKSFQPKLNDFMRGISKTELHLADNSPLLYNLEPLLSVHLHSPLDGIEHGGNASTVYILAVIALLILLIACINYTNLATVQSSSRSAEIGIRKVLGAQKSQLFGQFIGESFLLTLIGLLAGIILSVAFLPYFNQLTGKNLAFALVLQPLPFCSLLLLCAIVALASGAYPAFILSNSRIISILKSGVRLASSGGLFRKSLIIFQFTISMCLIIATIIILQQLNYIRHKDLGYNKDHVIVLPVDSKTRDRYEAIKDEVTTLPNVLSVSGANATPTFVQWGDGIDADSNNGKIHLSITALPSQIGFIKTMDMKLIAGSDFVKSDFKLMDTSNHGKNYRMSVILNETAVKDLGWTPEQAIGKTISKGVPGTVKGVVKDFHFASLHQPVGALMLFLDDQYTDYFFVKVSGNNIPATIRSLQHLWKNRVTSMPFEYHFLDDDYNALYITEQKTAAVFSTFSTLAILLACMGLFGLAAFTTVQRTKEIGIRKVLGSSIAGIVGLIAKDFLKLTFIAVIIASPIAWYVMNGWLQGFAYRINIQAWVFVAAGLSAILIAFITVSMQSIKAALANPVNSLKNE